MQIHYKIDSSKSETEILVITQDEGQGKKLVEQLKKFTTPQTLAVLNNEREYFLPLDEILFIETQDGRLKIHTAEASYEARLRLYQVKEMLPENFFQVSKSTIVNLIEISATTRSISSCLISFYHIHKEIYASRRNYRLLQEKLAERRSL